MAIERSQSCSDPIAEYGKGQLGAARGMTRARTKYVGPITLLVLAPLLLVPWSLAFGQGQDAVSALGLELTLDEAIGFALKNNRGLIDARLQRTIQTFSLDVAEDQFRPNVRIGSSAHVQREQDSTTDLFAETGLRIPTGGQVALRWSKPLSGHDETSGIVSLEFSQPLLKGFGVGVGTASLRVSRLGEEINMLAFREVIADVVVSAIRAWRGLVRAQRQLEIGEASLTRARQQLEINRTLVEAGQMAAREILQSEAGVAERELALVETRNAVIAANFALIDILDIESATVIRPAKTAPVSRPVPSLSEAIEAAKEHSPAYARALLHEEIAEIDLEVAENDQLWDLSLNADVSRGTGGGGQGIDYSAGLRLTIPLWDRVPELGLMSARAGVSRAESGLEELRQSMGIAVRQALHDVEVGLKRIELARRALALAEENVLIERSKLQQGLSSTFQLGDFEEDLVAAQNAEVGALFSYDNALTALDQTLGTTLETWNITVEQVGQ